MVNLWHTIRQTERIAQLEAERDYLDERLAEFERLADKFVQLRMPDHMCRMEFKHLLSGGKLEE